MSKPQWYFREMPEDEVSQDPIQGEFFNQSSLAERLVRESLQNSLDARHGDETVRVRFVFSGSQHALNSETAKPFLTNLAPHLENLQPVLPDDAKPEDLPPTPAELVNGPMPYLLIEDFGTVGLVGDITVNPHQAKGNNFWGFFRSIGISPKGEDSAGSWGLGKWVFPDASLINSYFGLTRRLGEDCDLLMGMAIVNSHEISNVRYPYCGHFADNPTSGSLQKPVDSTAGGEQFIRQFVEAFGVERRDEPGLSVAVLHPNPELTGATLARAVITQYFLAIVRGELDVQIVEPEELDRHISAATILGELRNIAHAEGLDSIDRSEETEESLAKLVLLARWTESLNPDQYEDIDMPTRANQQSLFLKDQLEDLRRRYKQGDRLAFRVITRVQQKASGSIGEPTNCRIFIEQDADLEEGHDYFVRGYLHIPYMDHFTGSSLKARALLIVDEKSGLGHLLRDSEGPAHNEWQKNSPRLKEKWQRGGAIVEQARNAPFRIVRLLAEDDSLDPDRSLLGDIFSIEGGEDSPRPADDDPDDPDIDPPPIPPIPPPRPKAVRVSKHSSGFRVISVSNAATEEKGPWLVQFAYSTARRNLTYALMQFDTAASNGYADFSVSPGSGAPMINYAASGCDVEIRGDNRLLLTPTASQFSLTVEGFDRRRDTVVRVTPQPVTEVADNDN